MKWRLIILGGICGSFLPFILFGRPTDAAVVQVHGLSVSPAIEQLVVNSGQQTVSFNCLITNNTNSTLDLALSAQDFTALNNISGSINFLPNSAPNSTYGLADWIRFNNDTIQLGPHISQLVPVTIINTENLAPGGHYAAIKFTASASLSSSSENRVSANEVISTLVFLTSSGHVVQSVQMSPLQQSWLTLQMPTSAHLVFKNIGNTQTAPQGLVTIDGPFHTAVARGLINVGSGLVLPATARLYNVPLTSEHAFTYPGIYTLKVSYQAAGSQTVMTVTKHFLYINEPLFIAVVAVIVITLLWLIRRYGLRQIYILRRKA
jgi:hypothetical protein